MDLRFQKMTCQCLNPLFSQVQNTEQTQELRLSDGMPDIGRVLAAWGQPVLRSKEWGTDSVHIGGGIMLWALYAPEDGSEARCVDSWLPFSVKAELPEGIPQGKIRVQLLPRICDARSVSARKLMLRGGASVLVQAFHPEEQTVWNAEKPQEGVELRTVCYPLRLRREMGEKAFVMDEELSLPGSAPLPEKLIYYCLGPEITDQKVSGDKAVFRGNGNLHLLYRSEEGQLHSWDFPLTFSQFANLEADYGADARVEGMLCPTSVEVELDTEGHLRLKCGMTVQYLVDDLQMTELVEDAYSPARDLNLQQEILRMPVMLENRTQTLFAQQTIPVNMNLAADTRFLPEYPRVFPAGNGVALEIPGVFQMLYYDENGALQAAAARWEGRQELPAGENTGIWAQPLPTVQPQISLTENGVTLKNELPLSLSAAARQEIPMITAIEAGDQRQLDPNRPSLILCRAGDRGLWDMAKESGSTVEAIRKANGLKEEPAPGQMLLIPIA